jgi:hypothetical protein
LTIRLHETTVQAVVENSDQVAAAIAITCDLAFSKTLILDVAEGVILEVKLFESDNESSFTIQFLLFFLPLLKIVCCDVEPWSSHKRLNLRRNFKHVYEKKLPSTELLLVMMRLLKQVLLHSIFFFLFIFCLHQISLLN